MDKTLTELQAEAWAELLEKDDRTSPDDYPEMVLITREELDAFLGAACLRGRGVGQRETRVRLRAADAMAAFECGYVACERGHNIQEARRRFAAGEAL